LNPKPTHQHNSGKVILFGGLCSPAPAAPGRPAPAPTHPAALAAAQSGYATVALPAPIKSLAAGSQHVVMSDGERMWVVGRWLDGGGAEVGVAPFYAPAELLHLPAEGIVKVVAGPHSSGAISGDGRLFLAGRLLDRHHAEMVGAGGCLCWGVGGGGRQEGGGSGGTWERAWRAPVLTVPCALHLHPHTHALPRRLTPTSPNLPPHRQLMHKQGGAPLDEGVDWSWPGFGGAAPTAVPGVSGVVDAALGGWHALVLTK